MFHSIMGLFGGKEEHLRACVVGRRTNWSLVFRISTSGKGGGLLQPTRLGKTGE